MEPRPRRRLRSATVHLGALAALALTLSGCNNDDDDCGRRPTGGGSDKPALALRVSGTATAPNPPTPVAAALPERGGFGTHLASCGG